MSGMDLNRSMCNQTFWAAVIATFSVIIWNISGAGWRPAQDDLWTTSAKDWVTAEQGKAYLREVTAYYGEPVNMDITTPHYFITFLRPGAETLEAVPLRDGPINFQLLNDEIKTQGTPVKIRWDDRIVDGTALSVQVRYFDGKAVRIDLPQFRFREEHRKRSILGNAATVILFLGAPLGGGLAVLYAFLVPAFMGVGRE